MNLTILISLVALLSAIIFSILGFFVARYYFFKKYEELKDIKYKLEDWGIKLRAIQDELWLINQEIDTKKEEAVLVSQECKEYIKSEKQKCDEQITTFQNNIQTNKEEAEAEVKKFQNLKKKAENGIFKINTVIDEKKQVLAKINKQTLTLQKMQNEHLKIETAYAELPKKIQVLKNYQSELETIKSEISLYTDMDVYIDYGMYPLPSYGEATSGAYNEKLKSIRTEQKIMLRKETAFTAPVHTEIIGNRAFDKRLVKNQGNLLITAFNSQCDYIMNKINSKNYEATLTKVEKLAEQLEKRLLSLEIGISIEYVKLKMEECTVLYQYICQKQAEAEEQRQIRAQIREEAAAQREIERAIREAQKEEDLLQKAMEKARRELEEASEEQKQKYELKLKELTEKLSEAESKEERALSMAQQTKRGHVYIISNIGSFGEDVYKIGMTRRLEPLDRVRELGDASVPFSFDVHAMLFSEDAPALEKELHNYFELASVNKVNNRKEFFEIELKEIRRFVEEQGYDTHWTMVADATEFRQSLAIAEKQHHRMVA